MGLISDTFGPASRRRALTVLALACAPLIGACGPGTFDEFLSQGHFGEDTGGTGGTDTIGDGDGDGTGDGDGDGDGDGTGACYDGTLSQQVPQSIAGSTVGAGDDIAVGCGSEGGPEIAYRFIAPYEGEYWFDTYGSSYDTVLALFDPTCGSQWECNDDWEDSTESVVWTWLEEGQEVVVVIDGYWDSEGEFMLNIWADEVPPPPPEDCPDLDLTGLAAPWSIGLSLVGQSNDYSSWCGGEWGADQSFLWSPKQSGWYSIDVDTDDFDPIVTLFDGCEGPQLDCDDDGGGNLNSSLQAYLEEGEQYLIVVDSLSGEEGSYQLEVYLDDIEPVYWWEDFEEGPPLDWPWDTDWDWGWFVTEDDDDWHDGWWAARSAPVEDGNLSYAYVGLEFVQDGWINFAYRTSSEDGYDFLRFYIDGEEVDAWSGDSGWEYADWYPVSAGFHDVFWTYEKDGSIGMYEDTAWIDDIYVEGGQPW